MAMGHGNGGDMAAVFRSLGLFSLIASATQKATVNETVMLSVPGVARRILSWAGGGGEDGQGNGLTKSWKS